MLKLFLVIIAAIVAADILIADPGHALLGAAASIVFAVPLLWLYRWQRGFRGLDQWPEPYGRYYDEWLRAPPGSGDYDVWLAKKKTRRK